MRGKAGSRLAALLPSDPEVIEGRPVGHASITVSGPMSQSFAALLPSDREVIEGGPVDRD